LEDPSQGPYDGIDDTLFGVQNDSPASLSSVSLHSTTLPIFGFDFDGLCSFTFMGSAGCPFLDAAHGYGGPGVTYSGISADFMSGVVNLTPPLPPGGKTYFSLEQRLDPTTVMVGPSFCSTSLTASDAAHTITGKVAHPLTLSGGTWVIKDATVTGAITLSPGTSLMIVNSSVSGAVAGTSGGSLIITGSSIGGAVLPGRGEAVEVCGSSVGGALGTSQPEAGLQVCASTIGGAITASGSTAFVVVGDPAQGCATNKLTTQGASLFSSDHAGLDVSGNVIWGSLRVTASGGSGAPIVAGNTVGGALGCDSSNPAPVDNGLPNKVSGAKTGQCAGKTF
jgi:hypothetical protein